MLGWRTKVSPTSPEQVLSNAFTLNLDLIGPWKKGDHLVGVEKARHLLVGVLTVKFFNHGSVQNLAE